MSYIIVESFILVGRLEIVNIVFEINEVKEMEKVIFLNNIINKRIADMLDDKDNFILGVY